MAGTAAQFFMAAQQLKVRLGTVVELPYIPGIGGMTLLTLRAQAAAVGIFKTMTVAALVLCSGKVHIQVAVFTGHNAVHAKQGECRKVVVKTGDRIPVLGDMAAGTFAHLRILVHIICQVTATAILWQRGAQQAGMAGSTCQVTMLAGKQEVGVHPVIKLYVTPAVRKVAAFTLIAVAAKVGVIGQVATAARRRFWRSRWVDHSQDGNIHAVFMTGDTGCFTVSTGQGKAGVIMVKGHGFPAGRRMAAFTSCAVDTQVNVVVLVTV